MSILSFSDISSLQPSSIHSLNSETSFSPSISISQLQGKTNEEIFKFFYNHSLYTDVIFNVLCGDNYISFPCHKLLLAMRSPVFAFQCYEDNQNPCSELVVSDVSPSAFEALVKYCYGFEEHLQQNSSNINFLLKVFRAAKIYEVRSLEKACCEMFGSAIPTIYNVFELLDAAVLLSSESLKQRCFKVLQSQTTQVLSNLDISSVSPNVINTILDMPSLVLDSEYDLIKWLFDWGYHIYLKSKEQGPSHQTFQEIMEPYVSRLDLLSLKPEQFQQLVKKYREFFRAEDGFAFFMNILEPGSEPLPSWYKPDGSKRSFICKMESLSLS